MSFFEELKRRNVFRVGAAYAVASFVLLQVLDAVGEILALPEWGGRLLLAVIAVGFVVVLFVAWAYELTPEGVKRESEVDRSQSITRETGKKLNIAIIVLMAFAIGYLLIDKFYLTPQTNTTQSVAEQSANEEDISPTGLISEEAPPAISRQSVAVLPFENRSRAEEDEFFVEGVHDDLLTSLARIGSLKVISRTSVGKYRGTDKTIPEIAAELGVATVMEGAVQRSGDTVRINVQLIDAATDEHLWAEIFDRELTADNLFAIQSEISSEIAKALEATLSPEEQDRLNKRPTENLAAYNAYLRGRQMMARRTAADLDQAAEEFERAVELDPEFALAWVGISETAALRWSYSDLDTEEALRTQQMASTRALAIDPSLGEAYLGHAGVADYYERYEESEEYYKKAVELSPGYATAWFWYGNMVRDMSISRIDEAEMMLRKALELDPLSTIIRVNLAGLEIQRGRYEIARRELAMVHELDPNFPSQYRIQANLAIQTRRADEQVAALRRSIELDPGNLFGYFQLVTALLDLDYLEPIEGIRETVFNFNAQHMVVGLIDMAIGMRTRNFDGAIETARWTSERSAEVPFMQRFIAYLYTAKGDHAAARAALERGEPGYFVREQWQKAIERNGFEACLAGYLMIQTGDEQLGVDLLRKTVDYNSNVLPQYTAHPDSSGVDGCWIALGDLEQALTALETQVAHGHYGFWWMWRISEWYRPLWGEPRFEAALQKVEDDVAIQRANLIALDEAAGI